LRTYENLKPINGSRIRIPLNDDGERSHYKPSLLLSSYPSLNIPQKFQGVLPKLKNVWTSILKMDQPKIFDIKNQKAWERGLKRSARHLEFCLTSDVAIVPEFVTKTSATLPFTLMGFRSKAQVLEQADFYKYWVWEPFDKPCLWRVSPKHEFLSMDDINGNKIRTFIIPPLHLLYWQKVFAQESDAKMKKHQPGYIRYGITFQYGGFHNMIMAHSGGNLKKLLERIFWEADISGWDRVVPLLKLCWEFRSHFATIPDFLKNFHVWCVQNTVYARVVLPNGDIVEREIGNNSGSGTTTSDNCIMHEFILNYLFEILELIFDLCEDDEWADIFGDDELPSVKLNPSEEQRFLKDFKQIISDTYAQFGLIIKESQFRIQKGPIGMHFLGGKCCRIDDFFLPSYDSERIYSALAYEIDKHTPDEEVAKAYALMHLAWEDLPLFNYIRVFLLTTLQTEIHGGFVDGLRKTGIPNRNEVIYGFWLGVEGQYNFPVPDVSIKDTFEEEVLEDLKEVNKIVEIQGCLFYPKISYGESMLTKKDWLSTRAKKLVGVSEAERERRFKQYVASGQSGKNKARKGAKKRNRKAKRDGGTMLNPIGEARAREKNQIGVGQATVPRPRKRLRERKGAGSFSFGKDGAVILSECGSLYASSLVNPFQHMDATAAKRNTAFGLGGNIPSMFPCVPTFPSMKCRRHMFFTRGTVTVGTGGNLMFAFAPRRLANNYDTTSTDAAASLCPLQIAAGNPGTTFWTTMDLAGVAPGSGITCVNLNSDYPTSELGPYVAERLVCAGFRTRYVGAEMTMSGTIHNIIEPNHFTLNGLGIPEYTSFETYFSCEVTKEWCTLVYTPVNPMEYAYNPDTFNDTTTTANVLQYPMDHHYIGQVYAGLGSAQPVLQYEAMVIMEVIGENIRDLHPTQPDIRAIEVTSTALTNANQMQNNMDPHQVDKSVKESGNDFTATLPSKLIEGIVTGLM